MTSGSRYSPARPRSTSRRFSPTSRRSRRSQSTITSTTCRTCRSRRSPTCRFGCSSPTKGRSPPSTPAAAVRSSARSARSSMCRGGSRAGATPTTSSAFCGRTRSKGVSRFFITDDNFARNRNWEAIFDRMIRLNQREGLRLHFLIQVDTLAHKIPNFIDKAMRGGMQTRVHRAGEHQSRQPRRT